MYIFDTSPLLSLLQNFYRSSFPTLWKKFDNLIADGKVISTLEVRRELDQYINGHEPWIRDNKHIFTTPTAAEARVIHKIYAVQNFQQNIEQRKIQNGGLNADPFVVAKAFVSNGIVVTLEEERSGGARIPNICRHFRVPYLRLEGFMGSEHWIF